MLGSLQLKQCENSEKTNKNTVGQASFDEGANN